MATDEANDRIKGFDGLRALAALMVWLEHRTALNGSGLGGAGVDLFFVLSGFLIIDILRRQRERIERRESTFLAEWKAFVVRRAYRIFPAYYLFLAIVLPCAILLGDQGVDRAAVWAHLAYGVNVWISVSFQHWNDVTTHLWSLSVEEQFYVLFPILALAVPARKLPVVCAAFVAAGVAAFIGLTSFRAFAPDIWSPVSFAKIALGGWFVLRFASARPAGGENSTWPILLLAAYVIAPIFVWRFGSPEAAAIFQFVPMTALIAVTLILIHRHQASPLVRMLHCRPLRSLGAISYGFYVWHYPLNLSLIGELFGVDLQNAMPPAAGLLVDFLLPLAAAMASWRWIEKPILSRRPTLERRALQPATVGLKGADRTQAA